MRVLIGMVLVAIIIIGAGIFGQRYLLTTRQSLYDALAEVEAALRRMIGSCPRPRPAN